MLVGLVVGVGVLVVVCLMSVVGVMMEWMVVEMVLSRLCSVWWVFGDVRR